MISCYLLAISCYSIGFGSICDPLQAKNNLISYTTREDEKKS